MRHQKLVSRIAELREKAGLTQQELSYLLEVTESTIANYERGRSGLECIERTAKLCKIFNCKPEDLIAYISTPEPVEKKQKGRSLAELHQLFNFDKLPETINGVHPSKASELISQKSSKTEDT
jgi:transcriptional regulator with XRE-family HTH domain